jgi:hypothetical protein
MVSLRNRDATDSQADSADGRTARRRRGTELLPRRFRVLGPLAALRSGSACHRMTSAGLTATVTATTATDPDHPRTPGTTPTRQSQADGADRYT